LVTHSRKLRRSTTAVYVKLLLPPRQSRGTSPGGLVGIAGEEDLDAPDLSGQPGTREGSGAKESGSNARNTNGKDVVLGTFSATRKRWSPPKQVLEPDKSAAMCDQLIAELLQLRSFEEATEWAQRALGTKDSLRDADAAVVETTFASRMAEWASTGSAEVPLPSSSSASHGEVSLAALRASVELGTAKDAAPTETPTAVRRSICKKQQRGCASAPPSATAAAQGEERVNDAVSWHIDKSTLALREPRRYRDREHLRFVSTADTFALNASSRNASLLRTAL
jgi:hypothetical protein